MDKTDVSCLTFTETSFGNSAGTYGALIVFFAARLGQRLQRAGSQHDDGAVLEADPAACRPDPQLLIDALARHADHFADFLLGDGDGPAAARDLVLFGQANERAGEPARQVLKNDLLDLIAGPAQPRAQQFDEFHRQRRLAAHERNEFAAVDDEDLAIGVGGGVGGPRLLVEERPFAKNLAGANQIQDARASPVLA